jgi:hypothetical protein
MKWIWRICYFASFPFAYWLIQSIFKWGGPYLGTYVGVCVGFIFLFSWALPVALFVSASFGEWWANLFYRGSDQAWPRDEDGEIDNEAVTALLEKINRIGQYVVYFILSVGLIGIYWASDLIGPFSSSNDDLIITHRMTIKIIVLVISSLIWLTYVVFRVCPHLFASLQKRRIDAQLKKIDESDDSE